MISGRYPTFSRFWYFDRQNFAGLNAQSKGRRLGIYKEAEGEPEKAQPKARKPGERTLVTLLGRSVPALRTKEGLRAALKGEPIDPGFVQRYLTQKSARGLIPWLHAKAV